MKRKHWLGLTGAALMAAATFGAPQAHAATTYRIIGSAPFFPVGQLAYEFTNCPASLSPNNIGLESVLINVSAYRDKDLNMSWTGVVAPIGGVVPQFFSGGFGKCEPIFVSGLRGSTSPGPWKLRVPGNATFLVVTGVLTADVTLTVH